MRNQKSRGMISALALFASAGQMSGVDGDAAKGAEVFAVCAACHAPDQPARTGPDLRGVYGRKAASVPGFRYSRAMKTAIRGYATSAQAVETEWFGSNVFSVDENLV